MRHDRRNTKTPIAVLIPTLNEADGIAALVADLRERGAAAVVVADGGSDDGTVSMARGAGATVISAPRGRGHQLRAAAENPAARSAPILVLLHADTRLPDGTFAAIRDALDDTSVAGGAFRLTFDRPGLGLALSAWFSRFESGLTTFGDQAYFVRRSALEAAGGVPDVPLLEDVILRQRMRRVGRFVKLTLAVTTSARRFARQGVIAGQARNLAILTAHWLGVPPARLVRFYRPEQTNAAPEAKGAASLQRPETRPGPAKSETA